MNASKRERQEKQILTALQSGAKDTVELSEGLSLSTGDVHTTVQHLEKRGMVSTEYAAGTAERGYRRRLVVSLCANVMI